MEVFINNQSTKVNTPVLSDVLQQGNMIEKTGIAIAVNDTVIPKDHWNNYHLQPNDHVTIIRATRGG